MNLLTAREREILEWLGKGLRPREIGVKLGVSVKTVETHAAHLRDKLEVRNFAALREVAEQWVALTRGREEVASEVQAAISA